MVGAAPTRCIIPRWLGHGSLTILVEPGQTLVRADQVEHLAGLPAWSHGETLIADHWHIREGIEYYTLDDAIARCESEETALAAEFLDWLNEELPLLLDDDILDRTLRMPSFLGSYPVGQAARLLDADPAVSIGRSSLFAHMHAQGWIERTTGDWSMTILARRNGWLTTRSVVVPAATRSRERSYAQLYVTPAGLDELRRTLHALNATAPPPQTPPPLFDD